MQWDEEDPETQATYDLELAQIDRRDLFYQEQRPGLGSCLCHSLLNSPVDFSLTAR